MSSFDVGSFGANASQPNNNNQSWETLAFLLQQILDTQQKQLAQMQATAAAQDTSARWRNLIARWKDEFPDLPDACKRSLPALERAYGSILVNMTEELADKEPHELDNEYALQEFIDRYGLRIAQIGNILNLVSPLAEQSTENKPKES